MTEKRFARIEIRVKDRADLKGAAAELEALAKELRACGLADNDEYARIIGRARILETSQKLRNPK